MLRRSLLLVLCALVAAPCLAEDNWHVEANLLADLLDWHNGAVVAEIGAGNGKLTELAAQHVGRKGKVFTTELPGDNLAHLRELAAKDSHITAVQAAEADTNLPPGCCDSIFMRLVYHHFTKPVEMDASLFGALKPGGRLAVIDEDPLEGSAVPPGVPGNRVGHGIPQKVLISELTAAGFKVDSVHKEWPSRDRYHLMYCVVFRKPKP